jgi:N-methylhydantoinase A
MNETTTAPGTWRASIDSGGTYTSACLVAEETGETHSVKIPTLPGDPSSAAINALSSLCLKAGLSIDGLRLIMLGTSAAVNSVLQGGTAKTALLVTRGYRDLFRRHSHRGPLAGLNNPPWPLSSGSILEINERVLPTGKVLTPLDEDELRALAARLPALGFASIAVCFLHSYINPAHEKRAREILEELLPGLPVTISCDLSPFPGEYPRAACTYLSAAVRPVVERHVQETYHKLISSPGPSPGFLVMLSDGCAADAGTSSAEAARTLLSAPAGGITASWLLSAKTRRPNLVTLEIGGSCTSISIIQGERPLYAGGRIPGCHPPALPSLEVRTLAAGGGSIAGLAGETIVAGPLSAGADPGPACCGGLMPTCTDAFMAMGWISPAALIAGNWPVNARSAAKSIKSSIADPLGIAVEEAARRVMAALSLKIAAALKDTLEQKGLDPQEYLLASYGGAGPLLAAVIARECGIKYVLVPVSPGIYGALGMLSPVRCHYEAVQNSGLEEADPDYLYHAYATLEERALKNLTDQGIPASLIKLERTIDLRYRGQLLELNLQFPSGRLKKADLALLGRAFTIDFGAAYGFTPDESQIEIVRLRLAASCQGPGRPAHSREQSPGPGLPAQPEPISSRNIFFDGGYLATPVYARSSLAPSARLEGPAAIEEEGTVTLVWPGMSASVDTLGNIIIDVEVSGWNPSPKL